METTELQNIWKSYDQKIDKILTINKQIAIDLTRQKFNNQIGRLVRPKWTAVFLGIPYTLLLLAVTSIAVIAGAYFVAFGFGAISIIMTVLLIRYFFQLHLINQIRKSDEVLSTQQQLSSLKLSSFRSLNLAIFQLPFWSVCWVSIDALKDSPVVYGGINLLIFILLACAAYWLFQKMSYKNKESKVREFFLSGEEWEPIIKSAELLEQIKEYK